MKTIDLGDGTTIKNLDEAQKGPLRAWWLNMLGKSNGSVSLWCSGERGAGSSYVGRVAFHKALRENVDWKWEYFTADAIMQSMRELWRMEQDPAIHDSDDMSIDYWRLRDAFENLWEKADVIWIDELHDTINMPFWRSHVQGKLEQRVKAGKPSIVSTNMAPNHPAFADITRVIEQRFVIVRADYAGR
jgi:hypothetical protein